MVISRERHQGFEIDFRLRSTDFGESHRPVQVAASPAEIQRFATEGFLVREGMLDGAELDLFRAALDEVIASEERDHAKGDGSAQSRRFGGLFLRHLIDKHAAFHELLRRQDILSIIRAVLGPQIQLRGTSARIAFPGQIEQETQWHFHQRVIPDPLPPWFSRAQTVEVLLYLDDVTDVTGPLCVVPGSQEWTDHDPPNDDYSERVDQVTLRLPAGSAVFLHGSLWHRAMPTLQQSNIRRVLIIGFGPTWMKPSIYGKRPDHPLSDDLLPDADQETRELLGVGGWM